MRRGIMAFEEMAVGGEDGGDLAFVDAPENDLAEAAETGGDIDQLTSDIDAAADTQDTLVAVHDKMEESLDDGGMSEPEAAALSKAVEHMCVQIGFPRQTKVFPAMEGFSRRGNRVQATKYAMEGIKDRAKQIGQAILKFIKDVFNKIANFFKSVFDASVGLRKRAEALSKKAGERNATTDKIKGSFSVTLAKDGKFNPGSLLSDYKAYLNSSIVSVDRLDMLKAVKPQLEQAFKQADANDATEVLKGMREKLGVAGRSTNKDIGGEGDEVLEQKLPFGSKAFYQIFNYSKAAQVTIDDDGSVATKSSDKSSADEQYAALDKDSVVELADTVGEHLYAVYLKTTEKIKISTNTFDDFANKVKGMVGKDDKVLTECTKLIRSALALTVVSAKLLRGYDITVAKAVLDVCAASLGKSSKEAPKAA